MTASARLLLLSVLAVAALWNGEGPAAQTGDGDRRERAVPVASGAARAAVPQRRPVAESQTRREARPRREIESRREAEPARERAERIGAAASAERVGRLSEAELERAAPAADLVVRRAESNRRVLVAGDLRSRRERVLYTTPRDVLYAAAVAPGGRFTGALESTDGVVRDGEYAVPPRNELVVLGSSGEVVRRVEADVQRFAFSPDGRRVAYLVGEHYEGGVGFVPRGAFVLHVVSGETERVPVEDAFEIRWNGGGAGELFLRRIDRRPAERVRRFDPASGRLASLPSGAFHLSPDGRFALERPYERIEAGRCRPAVDGRRACYGLVDPRSGRSAGELPVDLGTPAGWAGDEGHRLLFVDVERRPERVRGALGRLPVRGTRPGRVSSATTVVWDASRRRVVERLSGLPLQAAVEPSGWTARPDRLVVRSAAGGLLERRAGVRDLVLTDPPR